jgi:hypothetical protein
LCANSIAALFVERQQRDWMASGERLVRMKRNKSAMSLGCYLSALGVVQVDLVGWLGRLPQVLFLGDPQMGLGIAVIRAGFHNEDQILFMISLLAGLRLVLFGCLMIYGRRLLKSYIASEVIFSGPTLVVLVRLLFRGPLGHLGAYLFLIHCLAFFVYTVIPVTVAIVLLT